jgi:hypothetical protein
VDGRGADEWVVAGAGAEVTRAAADAAREPPSDGTTSSRISAMVGAAVEDVVSGADVS